METTWLWTGDAVPGEREVHVIMDDEPTGRYDSRQNDSQPIQVNWMSLSRQARDFVFISAQHVQWVVDPIIEQIGTR